MKITASIFIILLTVPLILLGIFAATVRFQLLDARFWQRTFEIHDTYSKLSTVLKNQVEDQIVSEGGRKSDVTILTDLITPANVKDFLDRNIVNLLSYANGKAAELIVYVPVSKIPRSLIPSNFAGISEQMPLTTLLSKFNIMGIGPGQIQYISLFGRGINYFLILDWALAVLFLFLLFVLVERGKRFIAPGITLLLSGLLTVSLYGVVITTNANIAKDSIQIKSIAESLFSAITIPVFQEISKTWLIAGIVLIVVGLGLFFFKKPIYNRGK